MRKVILFMMTSLDGYFEGPEHNIDWHNADEDFNDFAIAQLNEVDTLLLGRRTYELMASYWPTPQAIGDDQVVAGKMNSLPKIVLSHTLTKVEWENTRLIKDDFVGEISNLKQKPGKDIFIFGSSDLAVSFLQNGLLDQCRIMVNPVVLGHGTAVFSGIDDTLKFKLLSTKVFRSGNVLLNYEVPAA